MAPSLAVLRQDQLRPRPTSGDVGAEVDELAEETLPKRRWVESWTLESTESHHGHVSVRVSQPSSFSFSGQLARLFCRSIVSACFEGRLVVMDVVNTYRRMAGFGKLVPPVFASLRRNIEACDTHVSRVSELDRRCICGLTINSTIASNETVVRQSRSSDIWQSVSLLRRACSIHQESWRSLW